MVWPLLNWKSSLQVTALYVAVIVVAVDNVQVSQLLHAIEPEYTLFINPIINVVIYKPLARWLSYTT